MKKVILPFLAFIALPTTIQANVDPKVAEMCMKATDFQGCVKSISGQSERELNITRNLGEDMETWTYQKLDETNRVAKIIRERISN